MPVEGPTAPPPPEMHAKIETGLTPQLEQQTRNAFQATVDALWKDPTDKWLGDGPPTEFIPFKDGALDNHPDWKDKSSEARAAEIQRRNILGGQAETALHASQTILQIDKIVAAKCQELAKRKGAQLSNEEIGKVSKDAYANYETADGLKMLDDKGNIVYTDRLRRNPKIISGWREAQAALVLEAKQIAARGNTEVAGHLQKFHLDAEGKLIPGPESETPPAMKVESRIMNDKELRLAAKKTLENEKGIREQPEDSKYDSALAVNLETRRLERVKSQRAIAEQKLREKNIQPDAEGYEQKVTDMLKEMDIENAKLRLAVKKVEESSAEYPKLLEDEISLMSKEEEDRIRVAAEADVKAAGIEKSKYALLVEAKMDEMKKNGQNVVKEVEKAEKKLDEKKTAEETEQEKHVKDAIGIAIKTLQSELAKIHMDIHNPLNEGKKDKVLNMLLLLTDANASKGNLGNRMKYEALNKYYNEWALKYKPKDSEARAWNDTLVGTENAIGILKDEVKADQVDLVKELSHELGDITLDQAIIDKIKKLQDNPEGLLQLRQEWIKFAKSRTEQNILNILNNHGKDVKTDKNESGLVQFVLQKDMLDKMEKARIFAGQHKSEAEKRAYAENLAREFPNPNLNPQQNIEQWNTILFGGQFDYRSLIGFISLGAQFVPNILGYGVEEESQGGQRGH